MTNAVEAPAGRRMTDWICRADPAKLRSVLADAILTSTFHLHLHECDPGIPTGPVATAYPT
ncbi:hypothetical protein PG984_006019 [Apiospora sp. TS-2023a]